MKKNFNTKKRGFSLVESLIAVFIFSLVSVMLSGAFSSFLKNHVTAKRIQRDTESAQYAMNLMAKTLRTSELLTTTFPLQVFDYSQGKCIEYRYASNKIQTAVTSDSNPVDPLTDCNWNTATNYTDMTSGNVVGAKIESVQSVAGVSAGKVIVSFELGSVSGQPSNVIVQSALSLRGANITAAPASDPTCSDGIRNGTETEVDCGGGSCAACSASPCDLPWGGTIANGSSVTAYTSNSVACGSLCSGVSETRTCANGTLSGTFANQTCSVAACPGGPCDLPWGGTIANGSSVIAYSTPILPAAPNCSSVSETRTCTDSILSGVFTNKVCCYCTVDQDNQSDCEADDGIWDCEGL